jgi:hypothetical protein|tara:strand:+ start:1901 stop:2563 length:663 start_codon:yes stop_codon:yes gene_type:complete
MTKIRTIKVGQDAITGGRNPHYALVAGRKVVATGTKDEMLELNQKTDGRVWLTHAKVDEIVEGRGLWANIHAKRKRGEKMRKKGEKGAPTADAIRRAQGESVGEAFPAVGLALRAAPAIAKVVSRGSGAPIGAAASSAYNTVKKGVKKLKKRLTQKEDIASATTTASIPNPAVTAMGRMPTHIYRRKKGMEIKMTDNRFNKRKSPVLLARFRKYMTDNGG